MENWLHPDCQVTPSSYTPNLLRIGPVFSDSAILRIRSWFEHSSGWSMVVPWTRFALEVDTNLDKDWNQARNELERFLANIYKPVQMNQAKLFFDVKGYSTSAHVDHESIDAMMQIYIAPKNLVCPGTIFNDPIIDLVEFKPNHGYVNINSDLKSHESAQLARGYRASLAMSYALR